MQEKIIIGVDVQNIENLDKVNKKMDTAQKTTNKAQTELQKLRKQLRDAKSDMLASEEGSAAYSDALNRAAQAQLRLKDTNDKLRLGIKDVGETSKNVAQAVSGLGAGFASATALTQLFAGENENLQKAILGVTTALTITQSLANFADSIDSFRDLWFGLTSEIGNTTVAFNEMSAVAETTSNSIDDVAKSSAVLGSNLAGANTIQQSSNELSKTATGLLDAQANAYNNALGSADKYAKQIKELEALKPTLSEEDYLNKLKEINKEYQNSTNELAKQARQKKASIIGSEGQTEATDKLTEATKNSTEATKKSEVAVKSFGKTFLTSIGTMLAFTAAIGLVVYGISKLIEYINKVPEDVKLKIKLEEETFEEYKKVLEKVNKFEFDRQNARTALQKKQLDEVAKKEFNITNERLKQIKTTANGWRLFFTEYLKLAKDTYYNEALIKQRVDAAIQSQSAAARRDVILQGIQGLMTEAGFNQKVIEKTITDIRSGKRVTRGLQIDAQVREWRKLNDEVIEAKKNLQALNRIELKNIPNTFLSNVPTTTEDKQKPTLDYTPLLVVNPTEKQLKASERNIQKYFIELFRRVQLNLKKAIGKSPDLAKATNTLTTIFEGERVNIGVPVSTENFEKEFERIDQKRQNYVDKERKSFEDRMNFYQSFTDSLASITDSIAGLYDVRLQALDNYYNSEAELINNSVRTEEEKNALLAKLDEKRFKEQQRLFEAQKKFQEAFVYLNLASGLMNIYTRATLPVSAGGSPSPFNWIAAGLETAALIAQSVLSIQSIKAQKLQSPQSTQTSVALGSLTSLSPTRTATRTREENLNMITQASDFQSVVRVSDINRVQENVKVRDDFSSF